MINLFSFYKGKSGFTLIEIVIVLFMLSILSMMAVPRYSAFIEHSRISNDKQLASIIANAGVAYIASHKEDESFSNDDVTLENLYSSKLIHKQYNSDDLKSETYTNIEINYDGTFVRCILDGDVDYIVIK